MKNKYILAAIAFSFIACSKENPVFDESSIDASNIVFNIDVRSADISGTKGVKTAWENGDIVYVLFEDNAEQYVKMTYNGASWEYTDKDGGTSFTGLNLRTSGKHLSATYAPSVISGFHPYHNGTRWSLSTTGYFQAASNVPYTVLSNGDNPASLNATISLSFPGDNAVYLMQFFIPDSEAPDISYDQYWLLATDVKPFGWNGFSAAGSANDITMETAGYPISGYRGALDNQSGYYFWGILDGHGAHNFKFQLVHTLFKNSRYFAISSKSKNVGTKTITGPIAIKLTSLTDNGKFVDLGYGGPLWATGNLKDEGDHIADPFVAGDFYMWGDGIAYNPTNYTTVNQYSTSTTDIQGTEKDTARKVSGNSSWKMPTKAQFEALQSNTTQTWAQISNVGYSNGGYIITSNNNTITIYMPFAGYYGNGIRYETGDNGFYWTSTPTTSGTYELYVNWENYHLNWATDPNKGLSVRPIKN